MIRTKKYFRWALISDLIANTDNTPEKNIAIANQYLDFIYGKPANDKIAKLELTKAGTDRREAKI